MAQVLWPSLVITAKQRHRRTEVNPTMIGKMCSAVHAQHEGVGPNTGPQGQGGTCHEYR